jgi:hypothetical protein
MFIFPALHQVALGHLGAGMRFLTPTSKFKILTSFRLKPSLQLNSVLRCNLEVLSYVYPLRHQTDSSALWAGEVGMGPDSHARAKGAKVSATTQTPQPDTPMLCPNSSNNNNTPTKRFPPLIARCTISQPFLHPSSE